MYWFCIKDENPLHFELEHFHSLVTSEIETNQLSLKRNPLKPLQKADIATPNKYDRVADSTSYGDYFITFFKLRTTLSHFLPIGSFLHACKGSGATDMTEHVP